MADNNSKNKQITRLSEFEANIKGTTNSFFTGVDNTINMELDPAVYGYSFIFWVKLPEWFDQDPDLKYFKNITEKNFLSFQGLTDMEVNFNEKQTGFHATQYDIVAGITKGNTDFTIRHKEFRGSPIRKLYQKWITYVADTRTGIALYPSIFDVEYSQKNHTAQLLFVQVNPDIFMQNGRGNTVEFAAYYSNVFPRNIPLSQYNYEMGVHESPDIDITFTGVLDLGPDVEALAAEYIKTYINGDSDNAIRFIDSFGVKLEGDSSFIEELGLAKPEE